MTDRIDTAVTSASAVQLRRLISLADERPQTTEAVIPRLADPTELAILIDEIRPASTPAGDHLIAGVLDPGTGLGTFEATRRTARDLVEEAQNVKQRAAAELLYHAAVAAAYAQHGTNIASRPIEARQSLYVRLARLLGSGPIADLFRSVKP